MKGFRNIAVLFLLVFCSVELVRGQSPAPMDTDPIQMPPIGSNALRVITPTLVELVLVNTKAPDPAQITQWNFVDSSGVLHLPAASEFVVTADGLPIAVQSVGFKRRPYYAPIIDYPKTINDRDLRVMNSIYLTLASPVVDNQTVTVTNPSGALWSSSMTFVDTADPLRWSPAIHVNQVGYMPGKAKVAMVGYYLGSMGELNLGPTAFQLLDTKTQAVVYQGLLSPRPDVGFSLSPLPYQNVMQADFTAFNTPGEYVLEIPGMGASFPFFINDGIAATSARAYALGLYHQRCGCALAMPYTRFTHGVCHAAPAEIPTASHPTWQFIAQVGQGLTPTTILYPFINQGTVDVSHGHHDAGDYSKYTINSAQLVHHLIFAADAFPGVADLDNMGIPESGDGKSDILQEAKWEADFLAKMQDSDGGFYFLVYPRARKYESDVTPDHGDTQVVWPKQTAVTASATAALAEAASSPRFKQQFPAEAALYMQKAQLGWTFLQNAIAKYGKDGSYQTVTHYGDVFGHNDELAWAASAMYAATGDPQYQTQLMAWLPDPTAASVKRWGWWRLFEGYGGAIRTYAFAARTGRLSVSQLDPAYLAKCESEVKAAGQDQLDRANGSAYGTSFPNDNKRYMTAGWYFSAGQAFDMAVAYQLNPDPAFIDAIVSNMNFEFGCNPVNMTFVTGTGWKHQREIVSQFAHNDIHVLPPSGLPTGNLQEEFMYLNTYPELRSLAYPADVKTAGGYLLYDRWADSWNVNTEAVVVDQARGLGCMAFLMTQTTLKDQGWVAIPGQITGLPAQAAVSQAVTASVQVPGMDLTNTSIVWEAAGMQPAFGKTFTIAPTTAGNEWVEAEVLWPDGRRAFAQASYQVGGTAPSVPTVTVAATDPNASKVSLHNGIFTFTRTGATTAALTVNYSVSGTAAGGTDYNALSGSVTIPTGASSAPVIVTPIADAGGATKTVIVGISSNAAYQMGSPNNATVNIADSPPPPTQPVVSLACTGSTCSQGGNMGSVMLSRTGSTASSLAVNYGIGGTAVYGADYTLSGSATIPAGATSSTVMVIPNNNAVITTPKTVVCSIKAGSSYQMGSSTSATVNLIPAATSTPTVSIAATNPNASNSGPTNGAFTITRGGSTSAALAVNYSVSGTAIGGTDYNALSGSVTIPAGASSAPVIVTPIANAGIGGTKTVIVNLAASAAYQISSPSSATVNIANAGAVLPTVNVSATANAVGTTHTNGQFAITRSGSTSSALTVRYSMSGTAINGVNYDMLSGAVTIPAGTAAVNVIVIPIQNGVKHLPETAVMTISPNAAYTVGGMSSDTVTVSY